MSRCQAVWTRFILCRCESPITRLLSTFDKKRGLKEDGMKAHLGIGRVVYTQWSLKAMWREICAGYEITKKRPYRAKRCGTVGESVEKCGVVIATASCTNIEKS